MVFDLTRSIIGDTTTPGGQIFTNSFLYGANNNGPMQSAYNWLFERMRTQNDRRARRTQFALVNPNINYLSPATCGFSNFGNPIDIWERGSVTAYPITALTVTPASTGVDPFVQVAIAHSGAIISGQIVESVLIQGLTDDVNDYFTVNVPDSSHVNLMGCVAVAAPAWTNPSGQILFSTQQWPTDPMNRVWDLNQIINNQQAPQTQFLSWQWQSGIIRFPPVVAAREIRITYNLSGQIPNDPGQSLGVDDCLNVLAYRLAAIAGGSKVDAARRQELYVQADKLMDEFLRPVTKDLQRERLVVPPFRPTRNTGIYNPY